MNQPGFDWGAARAARDAGIQTAAEHADAVMPKWSERAFDVLRCFCHRPGGGGEVFTSEDVRDYAKNLGLPDPPHLRAWGGVFQRAAREGLIVKAGVTTARATRVHCSIVATWRAV